MKKEETEGKRRRAAERNRELADGALLVLLVLLAFSSALPNGWIWDDDDHVTGNTTLTSLDGLSKIWLDREATPQYYPLVHTSFWIERHLWGTETGASGLEIPRPFGYHLDNVLLHTLGAVTLWLLLRRLRLGGAWFAATIFAVHPVMVESVAWVTERKNVLSLFLALASAYAYLGWVEGSRRRSLVASVLFFLLAILSKTVVASLPAALLLVLWWKRTRLELRVVAPLLAMLLVGGVLGWMTAVDERVHVGAEGGYWDHGLVERGLIAGRALWFYAGKLLLPHNLNFIYPRWEIDPRSFVSYLYPAAVVLLVAMLFLLRRRIGRGSLVGTLIFCGVLFPALGFLDVLPHMYSFVADHFQYHAAVAFLAMLAVGMARLPLFRLAGGREVSGPVAGAHPPLSLACWGLVILVLAGSTWSRCRQYKDAETLWLGVVERNPGAFLAHNNLGVIEFRRGNVDEATRFFEKALEADGDYVLALNNLGRLYDEQGRTEEAESLLLRAVTRAPDYVKAHVNLGHLYSRQRRYDRATAHYEKANRLNEAGPIPHVSLLLGRIYAGEGQTEASVRNYRIALLGRGTAEEAAIGLIWILATHEDESYRSAAEAMDLAERLRGTSLGGSYRALDAMAAAHAEARRFDEAVALAREALDLARRAGRSAHAAGIGRRLESYEEGRPWRSRHGSPG